MTFLTAKKGSLEEDHPSVLSMGLWRAGQHPHLDSQPHGGGQSMWHKESFVKAQTEPQGQWEAGAPPLARTGSCPRSAPPRKAATGAWVAGSAAPDLALPPIPKPGRRGEKRSQPHLAHLALTHPQARHCLPTQGESEAAVWGCFGLGTHPAQKGTPSLPGEG